MRTVQVAYVTMSQSRESCMMIWKRHVVKGPSVEFCVHRRSDRQSRCR